jgi:hypothetical protein
MRYTVAIFVLFLFAAGCKQTNSPANAPAGIVFRQAGAGSNYNFIQTQFLFGTMSGQEPVTWTVAADNLTILGRSPARLFTLTTSTGGSPSDSLFLIYETNGDLSIHRPLTNSNATWIRFPTSGGNGDFQVLIDTPNNYTTIKTMFFGTASIPTAMGPISAQGVIDVTTAIDSTLGETNVAYDTTWYAPSIGFIAKEVAASAGLFGSGDSLYMTSYSIN